MTIMTDIHTWRHPGHSRLGSWLVDAMALPVTWARRIQQRRELNVLLSQPEHMLRDIGLERGTVTRESLKHFWSA